MSSTVTWATAHEYRDIRYEVSGTGIAKITIDLQKVRNAFRPLTGREMIDALNRLRDELRVNTTCGASNVSFGLPAREGINAAFLSMAISNGLTSAITNHLTGRKPRPSPSPLKWTTSFTSGITPSVSSATNAWRPAEPTPKILSRSPSRGADLTRESRLSMSFHCPIRPACTAGTASGSARQER